ncbi:hypothetical protein BDV95DRAFT_481537 [Massariosphaeria phaeospora]|uniref:Uncharacterized protein n=1 Tax=Massariosphaeria phaeospora TaxID=100035 RepID=A0A7C8IPX2_9PLEO|nr:hypothetical protein BDV95DRAFT_481537 [Massariosphaeria phaeospora]
MQFFATQLRPSQQTTQSLRAAQYKPATKRKRDEEDEDEDGSQTSPGRDATDPLAPSNAVSDTLEIAQLLRVAGLSNEDGHKVPLPPFPHAPARTRKEKLTNTRIQKELFGLDPPIYTNAPSKSFPVDGKSDAPALRHTHLNALNTLLHQSLLGGDYNRAGKAWGMILRTHVAGQPIDPRNHGRWGIGAEILLRQRSLDGSNRSEETLYVAGDDHSPINEKEPFTEKGFERAREYYERLIVQHPNRKLAPHAVDDRTFYPAMFSLWIYEVTEKSKRARQRYEERIRGSRNGSSSLDGDTSMDSEDAHARDNAIQTEELAGARQIGDRLDQLLASPPLDKHTELLRLRGMVGLWLGDLVLGKSSAQRAQDGWDSGSDGQYHDESKESRTESRRKLSKSLEEFSRAQEIFSRTQTAEEPLMSGLEFKIAELDKQLAKP